MFERRPFLFACCTIALTAAAASAQTSQKPPDCTAPEHHAFDFWVGQWEVRAPDGKVAGTNDISSILNGCVNLEEWTGSQGGSGKSFNMYSRADRKWHQTWVDANGGRLDLVGGFEDGKLTLIGENVAPDGSRMMQKLVFEKIAGSPHKVRQLWHQSRDGGQSWAVAFDGMYEQKTGK
jgi:hypothetical protein